MHDTWLIAGLGNPGPKYERTRHNIGFRVVDALAREYGSPFRPGKWEAELATGRSQAGARLVFLKPQTFMNLSGKAIQPALAHYKLPLERLLVVHDEIDLPFGELRFKDGGGHRGHNGLRDIKSRLGSGEFLRLRFGVGRPENEHLSVADYVLSSFSKTEEEALLDLVPRAVSMIREHCGI